MRRDILKEMIGDIETEIHFLKERTKREEIKLRALHLLLLAFDPDEEEKEEA